MNTPIEKKKIEAIARMKQLKLHISFECLLFIIVIFQKCLYNYFSRSSSLSYPLLFYVFL